MTQIGDVKAAIQSGLIPAIFTKEDLIKEKIAMPNHLSNYDKKNAGSSNKNKKVLVSREINGIIYYAFDEQIFPA